MAETRLPGFKGAHVISTPGCQRRGGAEFDEAVQKLRRAYFQALQGWNGSQMNLHLVMTIDLVEDEQ